MIKDRAPINGERICCSQMILGKLKKKKIRTLGSYTKVDSREVKNLEAKRKI